MSEPVAWLIQYEPAHEHRAVLLDRARAELQATRLHGVLVPLVPQVCGDFCPTGRENSAESATREPRSPMKTPGA